MVELYALLNIHVCRLRTEDNLKWRQPKQIGKLQFGLENIKKIEYIII